MKISGFEDGFKYYLPTEVFFGSGALDYLPNIGVIAQSKKVLFVVGASFLKESGILDLVLEAFDEHSKQVELFSGITKSDVDTVNEVVETCRETNPDVVVGIGGGAVLDSAKIASCLFRNEGKIEDYVISKKRDLTEFPLPLVAIPTTAGTGSEVSPFAVVWGSSEPRKYSFRSDHLFPSKALVDPALTLTLPPYQTACSGMDALVQAVEAYWSKNHNPISDLFALKAIELIVANLENAVADGDKLPIREGMSKAALFSGYAFSNTKTTICHSVSYPITAHFGVSHGHAVGLTLLALFSYNIRAVRQERRFTLLEAFDVESVAGGVKYLEALMERCGLVADLAELGIEKKDIDLIVEEGFTPERAENAPVSPSPENLQKILASLFK